MKKLSALLLSLAVIFSFLNTAMASEKPIIKISTVKQKGSEVVVTLSSTKKFIVGNNTYILHVGNRSIEESRNLSHDGKALMGFYIPADDFAGLDEGAGMYLTYGHISSDTEHEGEQLEALAKQNNRRVWPLGKFSKSMLTK